jgi:CBS domain-containing protein
MNVTDIMTTPAITVGPHEPIRQVAALLVERRISALPVVARGRLVGIVSEADLLHRHELGTSTDTSRAWWRRFASGHSPEAYIRSHAVRVHDVMTRNVVTIGEDAALHEVVALLESCHIRRLPVMRAQRVVGVVSRSDLVRALARAAQASVPGPAPNDAGIAQRLLLELKRHDWGRPTYTSVSVSRGVVHYRGLFFSDSERDASRVAAENIDGVRAVCDHRFRYQQIARFSKRLPLDRPGRHAG